MSSAASRPPQSVGQSTSQSFGPSLGQPSELTSAKLAAPASSPASPSSAMPDSKSNPGQQSPQKATPGNAGESAGLRKPPSRPQLMGPPSRPKPLAPAPEPTPVAVAPPEPEVPQKIGPISAPSERMQYRAIGMLKGKYVASEEQFNRGNIAVEDGTLVDAVLLGRVTSLIKKHIDLDSDHLWVVYPRTLYNDDNVPALHVQIVGVWEPETLNARHQDDDEPDEPADDKYLSTAEATEQCDVFSVRGEVAKYAEDKKEIVINIVQKSRSETTKPKRPFKLLVSGQLQGRTTGYFWDLQVKREGGQLMLVKGTQIAVVPPKKKAKGTRKEGARRRPPAGKPRSGAPVPKPVPKPKVAAEKVSAEVGSGEVVSEVVSGGEAIAQQNPTPETTPSRAPETTPNSATTAAPEST